MNHNSKPSNLAARFNRRQFLSALLLWGSAAGVLTLWKPGSVARAAANPQLFLPLIANNSSASGNTLQVGPTRTLKVPSAAVAVAKDGDVVAIDAGLYLGDTATWTQSHLTLRGVGGPAHLDAQGQNAGGKATWVIQGADTTVESIEFSGAAVPDQNGAGIRQEGAGLTIRSCYFHDNQEGILAGDNPASEILIEFTEFARNGFGDGYTHNMYINHVKKFTLQFCYSHHAIVGHLVKSRALENTILYNRIMDEATGDSSYGIDLPDGGLSFVIGNLVEQGPLTQNSTMITYAEESQKNPIQAFYAVNNTVVNDRPAGGTFFRIDGAPATLIRNNLLVGSGAPISGPASADHNPVLPGSALVDQANYDYHLAPGSPAIDAGIDPGSINGAGLAPLWEYVHPLGQAPRVISGPIDIGAYEYHP